MSDTMHRSQRAARGPNVRRGCTGMHSLVCVIGTAFCAIFWCVLASGAAGKDAEPSVAYRRIFVPADNVTAWPRDGEKFLPVESRDFENWIAAANVVDSSQGPRVSITQANYWARWDGKQDFSGRGEWVIALRGEEAAILPLDELSLITSSVRWQGAASQADRLGAWGAAGTPAKSKSLGLEVINSGVLEFDWHVPIRTAHDGIAIPWHLPPATSTRLTIDLPAGKRPVLEGSVIIEVTDTPKAGVTDQSHKDSKQEVDLLSPMPPMDERIAPSGSAVPTAPTHWRRWVLLLAPESHGSLRIVNEQGIAAATTSTFVLNEHLNYQVTDRGVELLAKLELTDTVGLRRELAVALPSGVQLISVTVDGRELRWRMAGTTQLGEAKAIIELPDFADKRSLTVALRAWQGLVLDKPWQLPRLRPDDVFWSCGTIDVAIFPSLVLTSLTPTDCQQTSVKLADAKSEQPEICSFTSYSPAANIEVKISRRPTGAFARVGVVIQIGDPDISGRLVTQVEVDRGNVHALSADLEPRWLIEGVETVPASALGKWYIDANDAQHTLQLQLADSVRPGQGVTVITTGRLQRAGNTDPVSTRTIGMLRWRDLKIVRNLVLVESIAPYNIEAVGNLPIVAAHDLTTDDRSLFSGPLDGQIFDLSRVAANATLRQTLESSTYAADIELDATILGSELRQTYRVICRPKAGRIERLLVFSSEPIGDDMRWIDKISGAQLEAERLAADDPRISRFPAGGEFWLLRLNRSASDTTEINATRIAPWKERQPLPLLSLPDATQQQGRVFLRVNGVESAVPEVNGLRATALPFEVSQNSSSNEGGRIQASYRYEPAECLAAARQPSLWLRPSTISEMPEPVSARRIDLESFVAADGNCTHRVSYQLENHGADNITLTLPSGAQLDSAQLDGSPLNLTAAIDRNEKVSLPLPLGSRFVNMLLIYTTKLAPLGGRIELEPPLPSGSVPFTGGEWTIWLPEDFSAAGANLVSANDALCWRQRLFGPLGRPVGEGPLDVLRIADWQAWIFGEPTEPATTATATATSAPVKAAVPAEAAQTTRPGWHAYHQSFVAGPPTAIEITRPALASAWSLTIFLFAFVAGVLVRGWRPEWYIALTAAAAALCVLLPATVASLATGAFGGLLLSLLAAWPQGEIPRDVLTRSWSRVRAATTAIAIALLLARGVIAQPAEPTEQPTQIHKVLIPVDSNGKVSGDKMYVSETFLGQLMRKSSTRSQTSNQWLLRDINCQGELIARPDSPGLVAGNWSLTFQIEVLARDTTVALPLNRDDATWSASVLLDGIPTPLNWQADGSSCEIAVREPGRYELVITGVPRTRDRASRGRIELTLAPLPGATIKLSYPSAALTLDVIGATRVERSGMSTGMLSAELDGSGQVVVDWPQQQVPVGAAQDRRITELRWMRVGTNGIVLHTKYLVEGSAARPDALTIAIDSRWELIADDESSAKVQASSESDNRRIFQAPLASRTADRSEVELGFRLAKTASLGRLQIPLLELQSLPVAQSWLAVSSDETLECEILGGQETVSGSAEEFLAAWGHGQDAERPKIVFTNATTGSAYNLAVRQRASESEIDEVLHVAAGTSALRVQYQANVVPNSIHRCQFAISVPTDLTVDEITLQQAGKQVPLRWNHSAENRVQVFFGAVVADPYRLVLSGHILLSTRESCPLPRIISPSKEGGIERIDLYREPDALVEVQEMYDDRAEEQPADLSPAGWNAKPIGSYQFDRVAAEKVRLVIAPNKPETAGETLTTLTRDGNGWSASFACRLTVKSGVLDTLRLQIPTSWAGPFEVHPSGQATVALTTLDSGRSVLTVTMSNPIEAGSEFNFEIRSPLAPAAAVSVAVPNIAPETPAEWMNYVAVPTTLNLQPIAWAATGAEPAELPIELQTSITDQAATQTFRVTSAPFRIAVEPPKSTQPVASLRLADTVVVATSAGRQLVTTRFVIAPQSATECDVRLPDNQELISVNLDSQPALIRALGNQSWRIQLGPTQLPQWIEVVTRATVGASSDRTVELRRPMLLALNKPISVEMSLWSLGRAQSHSTPRVVGASRVTVLEQMAARLDRLVSIAESATPSAAAAPPPDGYNWYRPWSERLRDIRKDAQTFVTSGTGPKIIAEVSGTAEEQLKKASQRVDYWIEQCENVLELPDAETPAQDASNDQFTELTAPLPADSEWIYCVADGGADQVTVEFQPIGLTPTQTRAGLLLAIFGLAVTSIWAVRQPAARDLFWRRPQAVGVLVGLAYWAWLWPSGLGLLIVAVSLLLLFHGNLPGRSTRGEGSTVLRLSSRP